MKLDYMKEKKELIAIALFGISTLFAVLICMKIITYFNISKRAGNIEDIALTIKAEDDTKSDDLGKYLSTTKELANNLKKNNLFNPPQPKQNPVTQVLCILGDEAFINNKWYKEGDKVQDAKIVSIEPTQVTIEWDGKTTILQPLGAAIASNGSSENAPPRPEGIPTADPRVLTISPPSQERPPDESTIPDTVMVEPPSQRQSPEQIERMLREQMENQNINPMMFQNMSSEQKEQIQNMIRTQIEQN